MMTYRGGKNSSLPVLIYPNACLWLYGFFVFSIVSISKNCCSRINFLYIVKLSFWSTPTIRQILNNWVAGIFLHNIHSDRLFRAMTLGTGTQHFWPCFELTFLRRHLPMIRVHRTMQGECRLSCFMHSGD